MRFLFNRSLYRSHAIIVDFLNRKSNRFNVKWFGKRICVQICHKIQNPLFRPQKTTFIQSPTSRLYNSISIALHPYDLRNSDYRVLHPYSLNNPTSRVQHSVCLHNSGSIAHRMLSVSIVKSPGYWESVPFP